MPDILVGAANAYFDNLTAMGLLGARVSKGQGAVQNPEGKGNVRDGPGKVTLIMSDVCTPLALISHGLPRNERDRKPPKCVLA